MTAHFVKRDSAPRFGALLLAAATIGGFQLTTTAAADDAWIFRRSYFSHVLPPEVQANYPIPESRSAYRRAIVNTTPGFGIRGEYRYKTVDIFDGRSNDITIYRQYWYQLEQ